MTSKNIDREIFEIDKILLTQLETLDEVREEIRKCVNSMTCRPVINSSFYQSIPPTTFNDLVDNHERYRETLISCIYNYPRPLLPRNRERLLNMNTLKVTMKSESL